MEESPSGKMPTGTRGKKLMVKIQNSIPDKLMMGKVPGGNFSDVHSS